MTTPITRRTLLRSALTALAAAPLLARAAFTSSKPKGWTRASQQDLIAPSLCPHLVRGLTIKVPANRFAFCGNHLPDGRATQGHHYVGDWDGVSFKDEAGCSNPAWVWFDLCERDYGNRPKRLAAEIAQRITPDTKAGRLDLRALYDYGVWCDELVTDWYEQWGPRSATIGGGHTWHPRFTVNAFVRTEAERAALKDDLRMRFLAWKAGDERYRTSWPGIPWRDNPAWIVKDLAS